ncbi:MAG: hypothetical protein WAM95_10590 [Bacillus sp. (in: firmicutes)]
MKKTTNDEVSIPDGYLVKVKQMNHVVEIRHSSKANFSQHIKKLDKDRYVEVATGEIKEFTHIENRGQSYNSLRQTFNKVRDLTNNNFVGHANELHVTITYAENMTDTKQLYTDFDKFIKRLRYNFKKVTTIDYLTVIEPQARGAWHAHVLLRFNKLDAIYIDNADLAQMWGLGFVTIKSLKDVDNIGAYLSAYLTDVELIEDNVGQAFKSDGTLQIKEVEGKKYIKGGRLHMYPPGMNLYRKSKGIEFPEVQEMSFARAKKIVQDATPNYQKSVTLEDDRHTIQHQYLQYNTKRSKKEKES